MEATDAYALVPRDQVDHLRQALAIQGLHDEQVEIGPVSPGRYQLHDEMLHEDVSSGRRGLGLGALAGGVVGLVVGLVVPQVAGVGMTLAAVASGAGFGGLVGGMTGLQRAEHLDNDPIAYRDVTDPGSLVLVQVHHEHWHNRARHILERHGAVFLQGPRPVRPADGHSSSAPAG